MDIPAKLEPAVADPEVEPVVVVDHPKALIFKNCRYCHSVKPISNFIRWTGRKAVDGDSNDLESLSSTRKEYKSCHSCAVKWRAYCQLPNPDGKERDELAMGIIGTLSFS